MQKELNIYYFGKPNQALDEKLREALITLGFEFKEHTFSHSNNAREIVFSLSEHKLIAWEDELNKRGGGK